MASEIKYAARSGEKREMWSMKIDPRVKYLAGIAARATGKTLSAYTESALEAAFETLKVEDDQEAHDKTIPGRTLAQLADTLYQGTEAERFLALVKIAPWLLSDGESKLLRILQHSDYFAARVKGTPVLKEGPIQKHWPTLAAIRDGKADIDILLPDQQPKKELAFGLMGDAERIALYNSDNARYKRESAAYAKAMKGGK